MYKFEEENTKQNRDVKRLSKKKASEILTDLKVDINNPRYDEMVLRLELEIYHGIKDILDLY